MEIVVSARRRHGLSRVAWENVCRLYFLTEINFVDASLRLSSLTMGELGSAPSPTYDT